MSDEQRQIDELTAEVNELKKLVSRRDHAISVRDRRIDSLEKWFDVYEKSGSKEADTIMKLQNDIKRLVEERNASELLLMRDADKWRNYTTMLLEQLWEKRCESIK